MRLFRYSPCDPPQINPSSQGWDQVRSPPNELVFNFGVTADIGFVFSRALRLTTGLRASHALTAQVFGLSRSKGDDAVSGSCCVLSPGHPCCHLTRRASVASRPTLPASLFGSGLSWWAHQVVVVAAWRVSPVTVEAESLKWASVTTRVVRYSLLTPGCFRFCNALPWFEASEFLNHGHRFS